VAAVQAEGNGCREAAPGVCMKPVYVSEELVAVETRLRRGARVPRHSHPSVQVTVVLRGRLRLETPSWVRVLGPGVYAVVPPGVEHWGEALEDTVVLDINAPLTPDRARLLERLGWTGPKSD